MLADQPDQDGRDGQSAAHLLRPLERHRAQQRMDVGRQVGRCIAERRGPMASRTSLSSLFGISNRQLFQARAAGITTTSPRRSV